MGQAADRRQEPRGAPTEGLARGAMGAHTKATTMLGRVQRCDRAGQRFVFAAVLVAPLLHASIACAADATPLYRFYNTRTGAHFYTTSAEERDHVELTWPWFTYEGIGYYVYTSSTPSTGNPGGGSVTTADAWRLLNQATFGASQGEAARVA